MADLSGAARRPQTRGNPHGKPSSWALVSVVTLAFALGGVSLATHWWWLFWVCAGAVLLAVPTGKFIGIMDDTVAWETTAALEDSAVEKPGHDPAAGTIGEHRAEWPGSS
jgi:hypothetical protein